MGITIRIPDVCERDIDLLLLEEFVVSGDFRSWFLSQIGIDSAPTLAEASRSVKTVTGESDLELTFQGPEGAAKVLIENKVDAAFQPNQPQRYVERADTYRQDGEYKEVVTVLIAPEVYFRGETDTYGFDATITYEAMLDWFSAMEHDSPRTHYKRTLLRVAIARGRSGWQPIPHPHMSQFWRSYWELATAIAPQLSMPVPKLEYPAGSHFICFRPAVLPADIKLRHKVGYGHVDLELRGMGHRLADMDRLYGKALPPNTHMEKAAKSVVMRARVEPVDMVHDDFATSEPIMRKGIEAAAQLLEWYLTVYQPSTTPYHLPKRDGGDFQRSLQPRVPGRSACRLV
jgi:choline dehydrogenase-like flavoprotein